MQTTLSQPLDQAFAPPVLNGGCLPQRNGNPATSTAKKVNILLDDDRDDKLLALEAILDGLGQNLVCARTGREALRHLLNSEFAVILMDVSMPDMDGFETAALIRQRPRSEHTPIIFVTAVGDDVHVQRGYSLKAVDYLLTPVVGEVLRTKVGVFVDLFHTNAEVQRQAASLAHRAAASLAINGALSLEKMFAVVAESARDILLARRAVVRAQIDDVSHHAVSALPGAPANANVEATVASIVAGTRRPYRHPLDLG